MRTVNVGVIGVGAMGYNHARVYYKLEEANLGLRVNLTEESTYVLADGRRLYRVFENLICNISKYSLPNTRVYIDVVKEDGKIITQKVLKKVENDSTIEMTIFIVVEEQIGLTQEIEEQDIIE